MFFLSRLWRWLRPMSGWIEREVMPLTFAAAKYILHAESMEGMTGKEKRDWVEQQMRDEYKARGLSIATDALLTAIQLGVQRYLRG